MQQEATETLALTNEIAGTG